MIRQDDVITTRTGKGWGHLTDDECRRMVWKRLRALDYNYSGVDVQFGGSTQSTVAFPPATPGDPFASGVNPFSGVSGDTSTGAGYSNVVNLGGASLSTVTPNPTLASVGNNPTAQDLSSLSMLTSSFGSTIADLFGNAQQAPVGSGIRTVVVAKPAGSSMGMILLLIGAAAVLYLVLVKKDV